MKKKSGISSIVSRENSSYRVSPLPVGPERLLTAFDVAVVPAVEVFPSLDIVALPLPREVSAVVGVPEARAVVRFGVLEERFEARGVHPPTS